MRMNTGNDILQLKNINVHYSGVKALHDVTLSIQEGEIVSLMGPNGAGKSTILKTIFGITKSDTGQIFFNGNEIKLQTHELSELGISFVPQGKRVFENLSVYENLELGGHHIENKAVLKERITEALEFFPILKEKLKQKAGSLSGGQQQMVAVLRGLITNPRVLLLDEPSLGLSPKMVKEMFSKVKEINEKLNMSVIIVEHNLNSVLKIVDRAYVLDKGAIVYEGKSGDILSSNILEKVFMGKMD